MPINMKYPLAQVIEAARAFDRRVTFEYVMLGGVNDAVEHALQLGQLAKECGAFVNLIPLHPGGALEFRPTTRDRMVEFARELRRAGVEVAIRKSRGLDIAAACGQLRVERLGRRPPRRPDEDGRHPGSVSCRGPARRERRLTRARRAAPTPDDPSGRGRACCRARRSWCRRRPRRSRDRGDASSRAAPGRARESR